MHFTHLGESLRKNFIECAAKDERIRNYWATSMSKCQVNVAIATPSTIFAPSMASPMALQMAPPAAPPMTPPYSAPWGYPSTPYPGAHGAVSPFFSPHPQYPAPPLGFQSTLPNYMANVQRNTVNSASFTDEFTD